MFPSFLLFIVKIVNKCGIFIKKKNCQSILGLHNIKELIYIFCRLHRTSRLPSLSPTHHQAPLTHHWPHPRALRPTHHHLKTLGLHHHPLHQLFQNQPDPFKVPMPIKFSFTHANHTHHVLYLISCNLFCLISK
jgi:hypothetical protein